MLHESIAPFDRKKYYIQGAAVENNRHSTTNPQYSPGIIHRVENSRPTCVR